MAKLTKKQEQAITKFDEMFSLVELQETEIKKTVSVRISDGDRAWIKASGFKLQKIFELGLRIAKQRNK